MDSGSFTLNLTDGSKQTQDAPKAKPMSHQEYVSNQKPLVSFAPKPRQTVKADGVKKPAFVVVRKKATHVKKKSLSELKSFSANLQPLSSKKNNQSNSDSKPQKPSHAENVQVDTTVIPTSQKKETRKTVSNNKKNNWAVSQQGGSSGGYNNTGIISSLFFKNPEIPTVTKENVESTEENLFSSRSFSALNIHKYLVATLEKDLNLKHMTEAQSRTIPILLDKKDAIVKSQTGSGKTLAYAIPIVEKLQSITPKIDRSSGVFALVVVPTRELVLQTYSWFVKILKPFTWVVPGYLIGGEKKKSEKARIRKGMNILISTPGRLLDHLTSTRNLNLGRLHWLIMDEADRLLDMGYEKDVGRIVSIVEEHFVKEGSIGRRQTVLLSATLSKGVEKLAGLALTDPEHIKLSEDASINQDQLVTPTNLKQWYIIVPPKLRLATLAAFILWKCTISTEKKVLVFMTTQDSVDYHAELFNRVLAKREGRTPISFCKLHGNMPQKDRTAIFKEFRDTESGVLLCTDVAARGLDLSSVDWIVQYNPPVTAEEYVHRVGRTARVGKCGQAIIFLAPPETDFVHHLAKRGLSVVEKNPDVILKTLASSWARTSQTMEQAATSLQLSFEESVIESYNLYEMATKGYVSFVRSYAALPKDVREVFNFQSLHLGHYAKSFALRDPPAQINTAGRMGQRNDRVQPFNTARQRNPSMLKRAAALGSDGTQHQPSHYELQAMLSEFSSGLDPAPAKKIKVRHTTAEALEKRNPC